MIGTNTNSKRSTKNHMKIPALLMIIGSILFLTASFSPISRVHMEPTAAGKLAIITQEPNAWLIAQLLYSFGAIITAAGVGVAAFRLRREAPAPISSAVILSVAAGAVFFAAYVYFRTTNPQAWAQIQPPHTSFLTYTFLTQMGYLLFGILLLKSGFPHWLGWLISGSMLILIILTVVFRDMPPFAYYLLGVPIGIVLLRNTSALMKVSV
jgi:hypothetical protein